MKAKELIWKPSNTPTDGLYYAYIVGQTKILFSIEKFNEKKYVFSDGYKHIKRSSFEECAKVAKKYLQDYINDLEVKLSEVAE